MWAAHPPCACPAIKAAVSFPTAQCQWTSFTVWGSACKSALVTLIRLGKCYPNSQHLLFDLLRERLSLSLRFPYFTKSNIFSNLVFQKIFKSKSTKEYKNCYPGPSGWTGNFLSRLLSLSLYVSVYVGIHVCLCMGKHVYMSVSICICICVHLGMYVYVSVCICVFLCFCICVYIWACMCACLYLCVPLCVLCVYVSVHVCVCVWALCAQMSICECTYILAWAIWELIINVLHPSIL